MYNSQNSTAFSDIEYLFNNYYSRLCYFAYKIIDNQESSKDIVQNVFITFWKKKVDFETELAIKNFLYLAVRNACLNYLRHELVEEKFVKNSNPDQFEQEKGLNHLIRAEVVGELQKAIELLPEGCRMVLKLAYFEGMKNEQIANHLDISINTVKTQKQRALQLLRLKLSSNALILLLAAISI